MSDTVDIWGAMRCGLEESADKVSRVRIAWKVANDHALKIGLSSISDSERRRLRQDEDALRLALDERTGHSERRVALEMVNNLVKGILTIPEPAVKKVLLSVESAEKLTLEPGKPSEA